MSSIAIDVVWWTTKQAVLGSNFSEVIGTWATGSARASATALALATALAPPD